MNLKMERIQKLVAQRRAKLAEPAEETKVAVVPEVPAAEPTPAEPVVESVPEMESPVEEPVAEPMSEEPAVEPEPTVEEPVAISEPAEEPVSKKGKRGKKGKKSED